jgi:carboxyl-terminal processing protease
MPQRNLLIVLVAAAVSYVCYVRGDQTPYARYASSALATIEEHSLEPVAPRELFDAAMQGMVGVLHEYGDEHSRFFDQRETEVLMDEIHQHFGGIGVRIHFLGEPPQLTVLAPPEPNTPAARAKLGRGDHIVAIDGRPTAGMTLEDVLVAMRGRAGTALRLTILPAGQNAGKTLELVRENITVESVLGDIRDADGRWKFRLPDDPRIAHVRIRSFGDLTAHEAESTLRQLTTDGVAAVVLDVRDNAGGTLDAAVATCNLLLPAGRLVVETRGRTGTTRQRQETEGSGPFRDLPLAVLINQQSASAAEIVAAAFQDHRRAIIVGQRTYGKGTVQQLIPTQSGKSTLKLTWASFWRPSGQNIHRMQNAPEDGHWGVRPDESFEVVLSENEYAKFQKYRAHRDVVGLGPLAELAVLADDAIADVPADFIDRQLARAVEGLRMVLDEASR